MKNKEFKKIVDTIAKANGFQPAFGGWYKDATECIVIFNIQKSNYSNYYYAYLKVYVHGLFNKPYTISKDIVVCDLSAFASGPPKEYESLFDLEVPMDDNERKQRLTTLFSDYFIPLADKALTLNGIRELIRDKHLNLKSIVKEELNKMGIDM